MLVYKNVLAELANLCFLCYNFSTDLYKLCISCELVGQRRNTGELCGI